MSRAPDPLSEQKVKVAPVAVFEALHAGSLGEHDLTARRIAAFLGQSTTVIYHHFGFFERFLLEVSYRALDHLLGQLEPHFLRPDLQGACERFLRYSVEHPTLYWLILERPFDWDRLRDAGWSPPEQLSIWRALLEACERQGSQRPEQDANLIFATMTGLCTLVRSGRANTGACELEDLSVALETTRALLERIFPSSPGAR